MLCQIGPECVSGSPTDAAAGVGGKYVDGLLRERDDGEERSRADQPADGTAGKCLVDEEPDYLGIDELQADAREQQHRHDGDQACLRAKVVDQQVDILPEAYAQSRRG